MRFATVTGLLVSAVIAHPTSDPALHLRQRYTPAGNISSFEDVPSSSELKWVPCYNEFQCANLEVPLDYENPSLGTTVVAWIRQKAANSTGIDVLFNPGGPGGSGINFILSGGGQQMIKATGAKYDIVSFDPRGVNASSVDIELTCFPGNPEARDNFVPETSTTSEESWADANAIGKWCTAANKNTTAHYGGTVAVVQDMIHFTKLQASLSGKNADEALIWYYGTSYGTVIGQTLAAMYPERVGRLLNVANVDGDSHYTHGYTPNAVEDADKGMTYFFNLCAEAGPKKCAFAANASSASDVEKKFDSLLAKLEIEPVQAIDPEFGSPRIITQYRVLSQIHSWLYAPGSTFWYMAKGLEGLVNNNASAWYEATESGETDPGPFDYTPAAEQEVLSFVTAIDAAGHYDIANVTQYLDVVKQYARTSKYFGEGYAGQNTLINAGMGILPPKSQTFTGTFLLYTPSSFSA